MLEDGLNNIKNRLPPLFVTWYLATMIVALYLICFFVFPYQLLVISPEAIFYLSQINELVLTGEIYRLITAMFLRLYLLTLWIWYPAKRTARISEKETP